MKKIHVDPFYVIIATIVTAIIGLIGWAGYYGLIRQPEWRTTESFEISDIQHTEDDDYTYTRYSNDGGAVKSSAFSDVCEYGGFSSYYCDKLEPYTDAVIIHRDSSLTGNEGRMTVNTCKSNLRSRCKTPFGIKKTIYIDIYVADDYDVPTQD